ncbi:ABC-type uncharacterized transport system substrate-binding protein [Desulfobotulus alkaliphilus]|uniref:ABC-type uncharacterized transport system substrate-binding protein n=2 Tax=Desulfobotulus alkaliphilus TaxID=622671 RepID=A0A562RY19_9BACT|nr:ABC-type uncharacterized transport system substrate-binding protein [Desulfobotulus alkaliphilus]
MKMTGRCWMFLLLLTGLLWGAQALAHPHVFVQTALELELDEKGVRGIWQRWAFDEYFSAWVIEDFDKNADGVFCEKELKTVYEETFQNLENFGFFTTILKDGRKVPVKRIEHFSVEIEEGHAVYSFFIPFVLSPEEDTATFHVAVYDESFFCHLFFPPENVGIRKKDHGWKVVSAPEERPDLAYYYGFMTPVALRFEVKIQ